MKIWVIGRNYPTKKNRMNGSFELEQAKLLAKYGNKVSYVTCVFHPFKKIKKWGYCTFKEQEINVYAESTPYFLERMYVHLPGFQGRIWKRLLACVEEEEGIPDIIHIHYPAMITIPEVVLAYQKKGTKIVTTEHWSKVLNNTLDSFQKEQLIKYVNGADVTLCVGQTLKEAIRKIVKTDKEITVVPNIVSDRFFLSVKERKESKNYKFVTVGRLSPVKQIDRIVQAFSKAFADNSGVELIIIGDGGERKKIEKIIEGGKVSEQVKITGTLSRDKVAELLQEADTLVCFSKYETFGVPVIEAWACGKPVIVSDTLGFLEYWNADLGYIVSHRDVEELAEAMREMYDNRKKYDAKKISNFAIDNFGELAVYQKLMDVYLEK